MVLCVDESPRPRRWIAPPRVLPLMPGVPERRTHDYRCNGTTNRHAALDVASGKVISSMTARHRAQEFLRFLRLIDASVPERRLVMDGVQYDIDAR